MTTSEKILELDKIAAQITAFKDLEIARQATHAVPGEGDPNAKILFIGEAPGFNEDRTGRPFVGQAGKLLETTLKQTLHLERQQVFITNIVKFRPPDNRDPSPEEIAVCQSWLDQQIQIIDPKIIVTLGRYSMAKFFTGVLISRIHGQPKQMDSRWIFPMYHPAAALRAPEVLKLFQLDFVKLNQFILDQKI